MVNYTTANSVGLPAKPTGSPAPAPSQVSLICLGGTRMLYLDGSNGQILGMGYLELALIYAIFRCNTHTHTYIYICMYVYIYYVLLNVVLCKKNKILISTCIYIYIGRYSLYG